MRHSLAKSIITLLVAAVAVLVGNYLLVHRDLALVLDSDPRNKGVVAYAHYDHYVEPNTIVLDLRSVSGTNSPVDVFRILLQFSRSQKETEYTAVKLAFRGEPKFLLRGSYFHTLGNEYDIQNPVYTMRTFPENLYRPDGTAAFSTWSGGLLGVLAKQIEDFSEFHKQWYINELVNTGN